MDTISSRHFVSPPASKSTGSSYLARNRAYIDELTGSYAKEVRTVKIDCPEDIAQPQRDHLLAFQVRNRGNAINVRYNLKLKQQGSVCYTPYRYGKHSVRAAPAPLEDSGQSADEEDDGADDNHTQPPPVQPCSSFDNPIKKFQAVPIQKHDFPTAKDVPSQPAIRRSFEKQTAQNKTRVITQANNRSPNPWREDIDDSEEGESGEPNEEPIDITDVDSASAVEELQRQRQSTLPSISDSRSLTSSVNSARSSNEKSMLKTSDLLMVTNTKKSAKSVGTSGCYQTVQETANEMRLKFPAIAQSTSEPSLVKYNKSHSIDSSHVQSGNKETSQSAQTLHPREVIYTYHGNTSRTQKTKSKSLKDLTAAFREKVLDGDMVREKRRWLDKMSQPINVIDEDSYDNFARKRKLVRPNVPRVALVGRSYKDMDNDEDEDADDECDAKIMSVEEKEAMESKRKGTDTARSAKSIAVEVFPYIPSNDTDKEALIEENDDLLSVVSSKRGHTARSISQDVGILPYLPIARENCLVGMDVKHSAEYERQEKDLSEQEDSADEAVFAVHRENTMHAEAGGE